MTDKPEIKPAEIHKYYFTGYDLFSEQLFNHQNLTQGKFIKFICIDNFTYDSDYFNSCLFGFLRCYNANGHFLISGYPPDVNDLLIQNNIDPQLLNGKVEKHDMVLKLIPSYLYDIDLKWCIYLHNDLDAFIAWVDSSIMECFLNHFYLHNVEYYLESNDRAYLKAIVGRASYMEGFDEAQWTSSIVTNNPYLFESINP